MSLSFLPPTRSAALVRAALVFVATVLAASVVAQPSEAGPRTIVYKPKPRRGMTVHYPDGWKPTDRRSALVIIRCHIPVQREHFRSLGMVVFEPRIAPVNSGRLPELSLEEIAGLPRPRHQVEDVKSAIRFVRANADRLGVDPGRIVATGTSGGGDLALQAWLNKAFEDPQDDPSVSHRPDALVLYCPAFDGIDIWFVATDELLERTKAQAPSFVPLLPRFVRNTTDPYATPLDHRAKLLELAAELGAEHGIADAQVERFRRILEAFNERDWQLLHPYQDALEMSASRLLDDEPFPPTLILLGSRDHLKAPQDAFVAKARAMGKRFDLKVFEGGGHSFMMQPAFMGPSTREVERFLRGHGLLARSRPAPEP